MRIDRLVIIAGGRATRLGPITATTSKALITVGQRPMIIQQVLGVDAPRVTVVAAPWNHDQVLGMLDRALRGSYEYDVIVQERPRGPADAVRLGLRDAPNERTAVLMADSLYDWERVRSIPGSFVAVTSITDQDRSYCWSPPRPSHAWRDEPIRRLPDDDIFTGLIITSDPYDLWRSADDACADQPGEAEVGMASVLRRMDPLPRTDIPWYDTGDVAALGRTVRSQFISREHHRVELDDVGVIHKWGVSEEQSRYLWERRMNPLFPSVICAGNGHVEMEYVDLPSLAELWLYWPGTDDMWQYIIERLISQLERYVWPIPRHLQDHDTSDAARKRAMNMLIDKLWQRTKHVTGIERAIIDKLAARLVTVVAEPTCVYGHGDLNLTNVLYSARTDSFKLLDPRGSWGDDTGLSDLIYELAKLRYSWHGFVTTVHGINPPELHRPTTMNALDEVIAQWADLRDVAAVEASLFWSAIPLHPPEHRLQLINYGYDRCEEAMS